MKVLGDKVLVKVEETKVGVLQNTQKTAREVGVVVGVGDAVTLKVKKGDKVLFKSWAAEITNYEDEELVFISEKTGGILAVI